MLGQVAEEDDRASSTIARATHQLLEHAPDKAQHSGALVGAAMSAMDHPSYIVRRLGCDILAHCLPVCGNAQSALQIGDHLLSCLQVLFTGFGLSLLCLAF